MLRLALLLLALAAPAPASAIPAVDRSGPGLRAFAEQGDPRAMASLGWHYYHGQGVKKDMAEAAKWFRAAAPHGSPSGLFGLSRILRWGHGVAQDIEAGDRMMRKAADMGDARAQVAVGTHYERERAADRARQWYETAAAQGDSDGQRHLGSLLLAGSGGPSDVARGLDLLRQSVDQGNIVAMVHLAQAYEMADGVERDFVRARALFQQAALHGDVAATMGLARLQLRGQGGPRDTDAGITLYRDLADKGQARAAVALALIYENGSREGIPPNEREMLRWLARAVELGDPFAFVRQGRLYLEDKTRPKNPSRAAALFAQAAQQGYGYGQYWLGQCLEQGIGVPKDEARALELYRQASATEPMAL